jgi:putative RecB family exonuclease
MGRPVPPRLSPSSMGAFTTCPLAFRFSYVDRLPEPPSAPASKGTLVHRALERLMLRPAPERTPAAAHTDLVAAAEELAEHPEFAGLELTAGEVEAFRADAAMLVDRYFELEDPATVRPIGLELRLTAELERVTLRGVIDRLELTPEGELVVTDYKTGQSPSERWEQRSLAGVHVYSVLCEQAFGRRPARVQLLYLSKPEAIIATPTDGSTRGVLTKSGAVMEAVRRACANDDFRPSPGPLCEFCSFREFCPSWGGDPEQAKPELEARLAAAHGRPPLPLDLGDATPGEPAARTPARAAARAGAPALEQPTLPVVAG